jgi:hypothetical protein
MRGLISALSYVQPSLVLFSCNDLGVLLSNHESYLQFFRFLMQAGSTKLGPMVQLIWVGQLYPPDDVPAAIGKNVTQAAFIPTFKSSSVARCHASTQLWSGRKKSFQDRRK